MQPIDLIELDACFEQMALKPPAKNEFAAQINSNSNSGSNNTQSTAVTAQKLALGDPFKKQPLLDYPKVIADICKDAKLKSQTKHV